MRSGDMIAFERGMSNKKEMVCNRPSPDLAPSIKDTFFLFLNTFR
jgi:hypothetical protein